MVDGLGDPARAGVVDGEGRVSGEMLYREAIEVFVERKVERCWTLADAIGDVLCMLGWGESREDILTRIGDQIVDRRADLYELTLHELDELIDNLAREHEAMLAELGSRGRPDLDEVTIAAAAHLERKERRRGWAIARMREGTPC